MLTINQLMKHLRNDHHIKTKSSQLKTLRNIGYYHGYKGYRFINNSNNKIIFNSFDEIVAINKFDIELKTIFYSKVMFIENALKSYLIECILKDSQSENLDIIFDKSLNYYKTPGLGASERNDKIKQRFRLKNQINSALLRDFSNTRQTVCHFYNKNKQVPIWAIFESLALGEFLTLFESCNLNIKINMSKMLNIPTNIDPDGKIIEFICATLIDLRNAIAHNNPIFDIRFKTSKINKRLVLLLESETGIKNINFEKIDDYVILVTYVLTKIGENKNTCKSFINSFLKCYYSFKKKVINLNILNKIFDTNLISNINMLKAFVLQKK